jgi:hypothetical protein
VTLERHLKDDVRIIGSRYGFQVVTPGSIVCHREFDKSTYGMVIHIDVDSVTVLWTLPPKDANLVGFQKLAAPLSRKVNYASIASQMFKIEQLPSGAHTYYAKDDEDEK